MHDKLFYSKGPQGLEMWATTDGETVKGLLRRCGRDPKKYEAMMAEWGKECRILQVPFSQKEPFRFGFATLFNHSAENGWSAILVKTPEAAVFLSQISAAYREQQGKILKLVE